MNFIGIIKKSTNNYICVENKNSETDAMTALISNLSSEIEAYNVWIDIYRKISTPLFEIVYEIVESQLIAFYGFDINISLSGSYENGLIMPWSDLNFIVAFRQKGRYEYKIETP